MLITTQQKDKVYDFSLLIILAVIWASSFTLIKVAVETIPPTSSVALRMVFALLLLLLYYQWKHILTSWRKLWKPSLFIATFGSIVPFTLVGWGQQFVPSHIGALFTGTIPLLTLIFAHLITYDERINHQRFFGIIIGLSGIIVLRGFDSMEEPQSTMLAFLPLFALFMACVSYAANIVYGRYMKIYRPVDIQSATTMTSIILILPAALYIDRQFLETGYAHVSFDSLAATIILGFVNTTIAGILFFKLLARAGILFMALSDYLIPLFGMIFGIVFLAEVMSVYTLASIPLILASIFIINRQKPPSIPQEKRKACLPMAYGLPALVQEPDPPSRSKSKVVT